jgi:hypothetical protein
MLASSQTTASLNSIGIHNNTYMDIEFEKRNFILKIAADNAIAAALQRNKTYNSASDDSTSFKCAFTEQLFGQTERYAASVQDDEHCSVITQIANDLSSEFRTILIDGQLRIGTVQKALNLYLKTLWCMDPGRAAPPHCPIDRRVLEEAGIHENWTQLKLMSTYCEWIEKLRICALRSEFDSLAEWELCFWPRARLDRFTWQEGDIELVSNEEMERSIKQAEANLQSTAEAKLDPYG